MPTYKIDELNRFYNEADSVDQSLFADQRSNISLVSGNHYAKRVTDQLARIRSSKNIPTEKKIRLTKNHIQKITKIYRNNILAHAPNTGIFPQNEKELKDQKAAEINSSIWKYLEDRLEIPTKTAQFTQDFIDIGECIVKIFWDETKGDFLGYEPNYDEEGNLLPNGTPKFTGELQIERIFGFNLLRDPQAKSMEEARWVIYRKMVDTKDLKKMVGDDEALVKAIEDTKDDTYKVFDGQSGEYTQSERGKTLVKEYYFKPCMEYPKGYFYITVENAILFEGELPFGMFPIIYVGFDEIQTSARCESIIKQLRPYQAEVNRSASKMAEHQIVLGDDRVFVQNGTKVSKGGRFSGVQEYKYTGIEPKIVQGRSGAQYLDYMISQIQEMYQIANLREDAEEKLTNLDPYTMLFRAMRDKKKFILYAQKFERFLIKITKTALALHKQYCSEESLIPIIGKQEYVNIPEYKSTEDIRWQIKIKSQSDDLETVLGKQLTLNQILQYTTGKLEKEDIGMVIRSMPFVNKEQILEDLTMDNDNVTNDILGLDRGEQIQVDKYDNHEYYIKRITNRMKKSDYKFLAPEIQQNYENFLMQHQEVLVQNQQEILRAQSGYIPSGGAMVKADIYVDKGNGKTERGIFPTEALEWLRKKLLEQGSEMSNMEGLPNDTQADLASMLYQGGQEGQPNPMAGQPQF